MNLTDRSIVRVMQTKTRPDNQSALLDEEAFVVRANPTIGVTPQVGTLTPTVRRLFNVLIHIAQREGEGQTKHERPLREVLKLISHRNDYSGLQDSLRELAVTPIEWNQKGWTVSTMLAYARIRQEKGGFVLEWGFSDAIREEILRPKGNFTKLSLVIHTRLRNGASVALFEYCQKYANWKDGHMKEQPWAWWAQMLTGSKEHGYEAYKYFKRDVISKAIAEVNTHAGFTVELSETKAGNRVTNLRFFVTPKAPERADSDVPVYDQAMMLALVELGIDQGDAVEICEKNDAAPIQDAIEHTRERLTNTKLEKVVSPAAYFKSSLANNYARRKAPKPQAELQLNDPLADHQRLVDRYRAHQHREAYGYWMELDVEPKIDLLSQFLRTDPPAIISKAIKKDKLEQKIARAAFTEWLAKDLWGAEPTAEELLAFSLKEKGE